MSDDGLYLAAVPVVDSDGTVHRFSVSRPDLKHLTRDDFNRIRVAFGQDPLSREEIDSYGVPDWSGE